MTCVENGKDGIKPTQFISKKKRKTGTQKKTPPHQPKAACDDHGTGNDNDLRPSPNHPKAGIKNKKHQIKPPSIPQRKNAKQEPKSKPKPRQPKAASDDHDNDLRPLPKHP